MAPRKRKGGAAAPGGEEKPPTVTITISATATVSRRVTRSSTRGASAGGPGADSVPEPPVAKKAKGAGRKTKKAAKEEENVDDGKVAGEDDGGDGEDREEEGAEDGELEKAGVRGTLDAKAKTIVIEHCKQCNSFKTRAVQVKNGLEKRVPGIIVVVNPDKPRRGCFEIREQGGEKFISLLDMKRPFGPMKALDMDKVILDIIDKVKA